VHPSSPITSLGEAQISRSPQDVITVQLVQPDGMPAMVRVTWPPQATVVDPRRYAEVASAVARVVAAASVALSQLRAR